MSDNTKTPKAESDEERTDRLSRSLPNLNVSEPADYEIEAALRMFPVGAKVRYWAGAKMGQPTGEGVVEGAPYMFGGHTLCAFIWDPNRHHDHIAVTHLELVSRPDTESVLGPEQDTEARERISQMAAAEAAETTVVDPEAGVRAMYARLAAAHNAEPTVPDCGGGVPGDLYDL